MNWKIKAHDHEVMLVGIVCCESSPGNQEGQNAIAENPFSVKFM